MVKGSGGRRCFLVVGIGEATGRTGAIGVVGEVTRREDIIFIELFNDGGRVGKVVGRRCMGVNAEETIG